MTENVVALAGSSVPTLEADAEIISMLENALQQARDGHLIGLALVKVARQPLAYAHHYKAVNGSKHSLAAGVLGVMWRISRDIEEAEH